MKKTALPIKTSVIIPAFNEAGPIYDLVKKTDSILKELGHSYEIIVVNDGSSDDTEDKAKQAGAKVISHQYNIGNGAAVKTGIRNANGEILIMMDGDGQHDPADIPKLIENIGPYDMAVGARTRESETSIHRDIANSTFNLLATYVCERRIEDLTSGFRAVKTPIAQKFIPLLPNKFSYPTTITLAAARSGYSIVYVPIKTERQAGKSKIKPLRDGARFLLIIFKITTLYSPLKIFVPFSLLTFLTGFGYGLFKVIFLDTRYGPTSAMMMTVSVLIFLIGLVSEQIAQIWIDRVGTSKGNE